MEESMQTQHSSLHPAKGSAPAAGAASRWSRARNTRPWLVLLATLASMNPGRALAVGADLGGYFRVMTRPDFQGGDGKLGYWNLYGRLLNEGPYATMELRLDVLEQEAGSHEVWTSVHTKIEGGSVGNADEGNGYLDNLRISQLYALAGNVLLDGVTWQVGTLDTYFGTLGLYDMWPARIFYETVGLSGRFQSDHVDLLLGFGDSGYYLKGSEYNTVLTPGGTLRLRAGGHLELGVGGQYMYEPKVPGNIYAPYQTPGVEYEDFVRQEVIESYVQDNPYREDYFPAPDATWASSFKLVGYLGFGDIGPIRWNNFFANYLREHPDTFYTETYDGQDYTIYIKELTDERYQVNLGNEIQLRIVPQRLDLAWGVLYGNYWDLDNDIVPSDHDRTFYSSVLRLQYYLTPTVHMLCEGSAAQEISRNGNFYREHADSIFSNTGGLPDTEGLEYGDTDTRNTFQGKVGFVLNPLGPGIFTRPSLRVLYGFQYSNQNNAFGNSFVETLDQYNYFGNVEQHWHHVLALETEAWF